MDFQNAKSFRQQSAQRLERAENHRAAVLLWAGVELAVAAAATALSFWLDSLIAGTGGLSGLSRRTMLESAQTVILFLSTAYAPFWGLGYTNVTLRVARQQDVSSADLRTGFRRFAPMLRLLVLKSLLLTGITMASAYIGYFLYLSTPLGAPLAEKIAELSALGNFTAEAVEEMLTSLGSSSAGTLLLFICVPFALLGLDFFYRYRLAEYLLLDMPGLRGLTMLRLSSRLMRGRRMAMLKLDLLNMDYWLPLGILALAANIEGLAALVGWQITLSETTVLLIWGCAAILEFGLHCLLRGRAMVSYACFYDSLRTPDGFSFADTSRKSSAHPWN